MKAKSAVTLWNYKIDFNRHLGEGKFGNVYALVPRPVHEQNYFTYCFPYIYDSWFIADQSYEDEETNKYCIKIFKCSLNTPSTEISILSPYWEIKTNELLKSNHLTQLEFFEGGFYSQIKTRVIGNTLSHYIKNQYFLNPNNYFLRASFVKFIYSIAQARHLSFWDLKPANIMFDENKYCWEIIDGEINKERFFPCNETIQLGCLCRWKADGKHHEYLFEQLFEKGNIGEYSQEIDEKILEETWSRSKNQFSVEDPHLKIDKTTLSQPNNTPTLNLLTQFNAQQIQPAARKKSDEDWSEVRAAFKYAKSLHSIGLFAGTFIVGAALVKSWKNKIS